MELCGGGGRVVSHLVPGSWFVIHVLEASNNRLYSDMSHYLLGSMPVLDENGIWADLQISYKGYFTLTLETQLNIDYYIGLVSSIVKQKAEMRDSAKMKLSGK